LNSFIIKIRFKLFIGVIIGSISNINIMRVGSRRLRSFSTRESSFIISIFVTESTSTSKLIIIIGIRGVIRSIVIVARVIIFFRPVS
jgi:hypothetical protein